MSPDIVRSEAAFWSAAAFAIAILTGLRVGLGLLCGGKFVGGRSRASWGGELVRAGRSRLASSATADLPELVERTGGFSGDCWGNGAGSGGVCNRRGDDGGGGGGFCGGGGEGDGSNSAPYSESLVESAAYWVLSELKPTKRNAIPKASTTTMRKRTKIAQRRSSSSALSATSCSSSVMSEALSVETTAAPEITVTPVTSTDPAAMAASRLARAWAGFGAPAAAA